MKQITVEQLNTIKKIAGSNGGVLKKENGGYFTPSTLSTYLTRDKLNLHNGKKIYRSIHFKTEVEFFDDIRWLIRQGYIQLRPYPYSMVLAKKFSKLKGCE
jgi:hypothetical protein